MDVKYEQLAESYVRHRRRNDDVLSALIANAHLAASSRVLEVGAGTGNYSLALSELARCVCTAVLLWASK